MTIRQLAAGLLVSAALAAFPATADASPLSQPLSQPRPEPGGDSAAEVRTASTVRDSLMKELLAEYAAATGGPCTTRSSWSGTSRLPPSSDTSPCPLVLWRQRGRIRPRLLRSRRWPGRSSWSNQSGGTRNSP